MSDQNQYEPDNDPESLSPSVRRYNYEGEDHFYERELLLESIPSSREMTNIDTASGSTKTEPNIETTEYIMFSINLGTFEWDFVEPNIIPTFSIRTFL